MPVIVAPPSPAPGQGDFGVGQQLGEAANFIWLITGNKPSEDMERTMDICYILHADHGFNASTFSGRVTIATLSDVQRSH